MNTSLSSILSLLVGTVFVVNGLTANTDKILSDAKNAVNQANVHQFATVLEIYYLDHNEYPDVRGGEALVELLSRDNYIMNRPLDPSVFDYEPKNNAQDYTLRLMAVN